MSGHHAELVRGARGHITGRLDYLDRIAPDGGAEDERARLRRQLAALDAPQPRRPVAWDDLVTVLMPQIRTRRYEFELSPGLVTNLIDVPEGPVTSAGLVMQSRCTARAAALEDDEVQIVARGSFDPDKTFRPQVPTRNTPQAGRRVVVAPSSFDETQRRCYVQLRADGLRQTRRTPQPRCCWEAEATGPLAVRCRPGTVLHMELPPSTLTLYGSPDDPEPLRSYVEGMPGGHRLVELIDAPPWVLLAVIAPDGRDTVPLLEISQAYPAHLVASHPGCYVLAVPKFVAELSAWLAHEWSWWADPLGELREDDDVDLLARTAAALWHRGQGVSLEEILDASRLVLS